MLRVKPFEGIPRRWFVFCIAEHDCGGESHFAALRLPSYQWEFDLLTKRHYWHQLNIYWHSIDGFSAHWLPKYDVTTTYGTLK